MLRHAALRKVVGPDAIGAVAAADQAFARRSLLRLPCTTLAFGQPCGEYRQRACLVAMLRALVLALHHQAGGKMGDADGRIGFVDVLPSGARRPKSVDAKFGRVDPHRFGLVHLW
ncbi:hypothetical protein GALL_510430 [mine drainage metagenome]|uniref:Uncharacterized protein n=1 Tax=mine drainage metagenome TaxID=410659 RepID=A0A1J5PIL3_9ZZZZ